ncbi:MAG: 23S rRNA (adenine(2030)-N(6))-methyltransferase RlmJ [Alphaproteobacteria bacterium]|nr:23S rRNA (adenine(2030)-N(6))-methyltransferase RlmJ [Alphaproteobacteria bacterium]
MNYRHSFHAGNFADVFKHIFIVRILLYLCLKESPFRVIDTHAGEGFYDLNCEEANRTSEWRHGVGRLRDFKGIDKSFCDLIQPYLCCVGINEKDQPLAHYPGSPMIASRLMRQQDRAVFCELHPEASRLLRRQFAHDKRIKTLHLDGYLGLGAFMPPKERRGLVLIDPPFEQKDEITRLLSSFLLAYRKWPTGVYVIWYPIKDPDFDQKLCAEFFNNNITRTLRLSLNIGGQADGLKNTGLLIVNPPFTLEDEAQELMPFLTRLLAQGEDAGYQIDWVVREGKIER